MRLLQTKLNKPQLHTTYIERKKIKRLLSNYQQYKMLLVSAPAGSGKSTVINAWLDTLNSSYSWYSLDSSDNDIQQFLAYLIAGLERDDVIKTFQLSELMASFQTIGANGIIHSLINVLYESQLSFTIVFDDYHLIENQEIHQLMMMFLEHLPSQVHITIITREDPPLSLSKLRVRRQLLELRIKELQFDKQETAQFMSKAMAIEIRAAHIEALNKKTEGWIAGLQLAALSLQSNQDTDDFIEDFSGNHYIADYLLEEVLNHMDQDSLSFLLATSILSQFTADLCDILLDLDPGTSNERLRKLAQNNAFIIPLDDQRQWYRYHHLFRDLLVDRLSNTDLDVKHLHYKASLWFKDEANTDLAIHHALEAGDLDLAGDLIENIWAECDRSLQAQSWLDKLQKLPKDLIEKRPVLLMGYAWALLDIGQHIESEVWLKKAQDFYDAIQRGQVIDYQVSDQEQYELLPSTIASAYCYISIGQGQFDDMFKYANEAFNYNVKMTSHRSGVLRMLLGLAHWAIGDLPAAKQEIDKAIIDIKKNESALTLGSYEIVRVEILMDNGDFGQASQLLDKIISHTLEHKKIPLALANFYLIYSRLHLANGDIEQSMALHQTSKTFGLKYCLPDFWYKWYQQQATLEIHQGLYDSAVLSLDEADANYYLNPLPSRTSLQGLRGYLYLLMDKISDAAICFKQIFAEQDLIYKNLYLAKTGKEIEAINSLSSLYDTAIAENRKKSATEIILGQAVIVQLMGEESKCLDYMNASIGFINQHCFVEPLLRYHHILGDLYPNLDFNDQVKAKLSLETTDASYSILQANQELTEALTPRELDILRLLARGYSNQEICDELFLALSTVKGYNQNLFGKLGVRRRTEAISKARSIGLIQDDLIIKK